MADVELSPQVIGRVREAADMLEIVSEQVRLRRRGRSWEGLCPFHDEKTPSFSVDPDKGLYYCFGCHQGGDVFKFVMEVEGLGFPDAVEKIARRYGVRLPPRSPEARRRADQGERLRSLLGEAQRFFVERLAAPDGASARAELERRGFERTSWPEIGFGFAPDAWRDLLEQMTRRHPEGLVVEAGLAVRPERGTSPYDRFRRRITFPIRSPDGALVAFGGRILGDGEPKYLNSPESPIFHKRSTLFSLDRARRSIAERGEAIVVEGYFDCLSLHRAGVANVVATLGTALSREHARLLRRQTGEGGRVILCYDADDAGRRAALGGAEALLGAGLDVAVLVLPEGKDPDDVVREQGAKGVERLLAAPTPLLDFLLADLPSEPAARRRAGLGLAPLVCAATDPALRQNLVEELARQLYLRPREIEERGRRRDRRPAGGAPPRTARLPAGECNLVHTLLGCRPDRRRELLALVELDELTDQRTRRLVELARGLSTASLSAEHPFETALLESSELVGLLAEVNARGLPEVDERRTSLLLGELERRQRRRRLRERARALHDSEQRGAQDEAARLLVELDRTARGGEEGDEEGE